MDPQQQVNNQNPVQTPTPPASTIAQPPQPTTPPASPQMPMAPMSANSGKKSKAGLFIGLILGILVLIGLAAVLYLFMFSPAALSKRTSSSFMKYMNAGDADKAASLSVDGDQQETKDFLKTASDKTKGGYKLQESTMKGGKGYYLYSLNNDTNKYSRTTIEKQNGKWLVSSYVYSSTKLALIPGTSDKITTDTTKTTTTTTSAQACLSQDDYKWANYDKKPSSVTYDDTYDPAKYTNNHTGDMFFNPDTTVEASFTSLYDDYADFAKHNADKQWKIHLEGSTYGSDAAAAASKKLANDRAQKVKDEMVKRGVPADRIVIGAPHDYGNETQDDSKDKIYRRVEIVIDPTCTSTSTSTTTSGSSR